MVLGCSEKATPFLFVCIENLGSNLFDIYIDFLEIWVYTYTPKEHLFEEGWEMDRVILHIDCDCFYASVEEFCNPEYRGKPLAVGGSVESRHGIILAKTYPAKELGVKTAEPLWMALKKCPNLIIVPPDFKKYERFSSLVRDVFLRYTDLIEPFGLDESWVDISDCVESFEEGVLLAKKLQQIILKEVGITVSIGVSFNKIFAKLGSDQNKPFGITAITKENYKDIVWSLPVEELLMVGRATKEKLFRKGITTIGELANTELKNLRSWFGKNGDMLYAFSNGLDTAPVERYDSIQTVKSIGNSTTTPRDLVNNTEVKEVLYVLAESVSRRMREQGLKGRVVSVSVRSSNLEQFSRQKKLEHYTNLTDEILKTSFTLFLENYRWNVYIRSVGICVSDFAGESVSEQIDLFKNNEKREKLERLEKTVDNLRERFGSYSVQRACLLSDESITRFDPHDDHTIHPVSYF